MNDFENACNEIEKDLYTGESNQENVIEFLRGNKTATISFCRGRYMNKILKLAEEYPDDVRIITSDDDHVVAHIPVKYVKISAPRTVSEEQAAAARERLMKYRKNRTSSSAVQDDDDEEIDEE